MRKHQWDELPDSARAAVQEQCGPVRKAEAAERGIMPGVAARLFLDDGGSVFLKAIPSDSRAVRVYARERAANLALPPRAPVPPMLWSGDAGGWVLLVFDFIDGGRNADLSPASPDLPGVLDALSRLGGPGGTLPPVSVNLALLREKATELLAMDVDGPRWGMYADALSALPFGALEGNTLGTRCCIMTCTAETS